MEKICCGSIFDIMCVRATGRIMNRRVRLIMGRKRRTGIFTLAATGGDTTKYAAMADDISVCIYWENDGSYQISKNDVILCVKVTCTKGDQTASMLSKYNLSCMDYEDAEIGVDTGDDTVNPSKNDILKSEHWSWSFLERE